jgi:cytidylate kinase
MVKRDRDDATRADSPLTLDSGYLVIDTGTATPDEVISTMEQRVAAGRGGGETGQIGPGGGQAG